MDHKYKTLAEFKVAYYKGEHPGAVIVVDNDYVSVSVPPDEDDEDADSEYLYACGSPREMLHEALALLHLPSEDC